MTIDRHGPEELPPELDRLHEELASLDIVERPSFGPELQAELERAWSELRARRAARSHWRRPVAIAATAAALVLVTVPQARASLVRLVTLATASPVDPTGSEAASIRTAVDVQDRPVFVPEPARAVASQAEREPTVAWADEPITTLVPDIAYPAIRNPGEAEAIVQLHYPPRLQRRGVGGSVRMILWVDESGSVLEREVVRSSGIPGLDRAALAAAPKLRFTPARRRGEPVGTWVEFDIIFRSAFAVPDAPRVADVDLPFTDAVDLADPVIPPEPVGSEDVPPIIPTRSGGLRAYW